MRTILITAVLAALAMPAAAATDYADRAGELMRSNLRDPFSVQEPERTAPFVERLPLVGEIVVVCTRMYAKNSFGAYTGRTVFQVVFYPNGKERIFPDGSPNCERMGWRSFPEFTR